MAEWLPLAEGGDAVAQNNVGALYDHGLGIDEDDATAVYWYLLAAAQSLPLAMRNLANMYAGGHGVPYDKALADSWYEKAAKLGDPIAIKRLAQMAPQSEFAAATTEPVPDPNQPMTVAGDDPAEEAPAPPEPRAPAQADQPPQLAEEAPASSDSGSDQAPQYGDVVPSTAAGGTAPAPDATQQAAVAPPSPPSDPGNWLMGMWQGPSLGCPPDGGMEFAPGETRSYYGGQIAARLQAKYEVSGDRVIVTSTGVDGVGHSYEYERTGPGTFVITAVPPDMPESMIGVEHRRCGDTPAAAPEPAPAPTAAEPEAAAPEFNPKPFVPTAPEPAPQPAPKAVPVRPVAEAQQPAPIAGTQQAAAGSRSASAQEGWEAFGRGDYEGALETWQPVAEGGDVSTQLLVGSIYDYGQGVPQDDAEAVKWYERAAMQGSVKGQYQAGAVYARSAQVKDPLRAYKWLTIATRNLESGPQDGITADQAATLRTLIERDMSEEEIAKAKQEADAFKATKE